MERIADHRLDVQTALTTAAIKRFRLDVSQIHCNITDFELFGVYESDIDNPSPRTPQPAYGRTRSGRKNVKQIQCGLSVTKDGGLPLTHQRLDGNTAESTAHIDNLPELRRIAGQSAGTHAAAS